MKLNARIVTTLEVTAPPNLKELLGDNAFYRETYTEFDNQIYFPKSSITDASDEFKQTGIYTAIKEVFDAHPTYTDLMFV